MVLRGIDDKHVWVNDPGRSPEMRTKGENICYPIKKQPGNPSYFDGCWTGRFIIVTPREITGVLLFGFTFAIIKTSPPLTIEAVTDLDQAPSIGGGDSYSSSGCVVCNLTAGYQSVEATHS